jgi:hypothetical protein
MKTPHVTVQSEATNPHQCVSTKVVISVSVPRVRTRASRGYHFPELAYGEPERATDFLVLGLLTWALDIPNDAASCIVHKFDADLSNASPRAYVASAICLRS